MLEYDPNLPQEFSRAPKRTWFSGRFITLLLAAAFLLGAVISFALNNGPADRDSVAMRQAAKVHTIE